MPLPHPNLITGSRFRLRALLAVSLGLILTDALLEGASWRSRLYPEDWTPPSASSDFARDAFLQDFSHAGYARGERAVPQSSGPLFPVLLNEDECAGRVDCTAKIQAALDEACAKGGGVVVLPAGNLHVSAQPGASHALAIRGNGVILRGQGASLTRLTNTTTEMKRRAVVHLGPEHQGKPNERGAVSLAADVCGPLSSVRLASAGAFKAGDWVEVVADLTDAWIAEHAEPGWLGAGKPKDQFCYLRQVVSVADEGRLLQLDIPLRYTLKVRDGARVRPAQSFVTESGIESLSIASLPLLKAGWGEADWNKPGTAAHDADRSQLIRLSLARDCWVRDVESHQPMESAAAVHQHSNGIVLEDCARVTLLRLRFSRAQYGGANGNGYMYRLHGSQDCLLQDCISDTCRHGFVFSGFGASGNVLLRCRDLRSGLQLEDGVGKPRATAGWGSDHHMWLSHSNLVDSCEVEESAFVAMYRPHSNHFLTSAHSVFWNTAAHKPLRGFAVISQQVHYGYVIGTRGEEARVSTISASGKGLAQTQPLDIVEGELKGDELVPSSLYEDQLRRRLGLKPDLR